jgi:putative phosphonate metabolism protein
VTPAHAETKPPGIGRSAGASRAADASPRYAIYFAPERDDPWWRFGIAWLGRDPESGERLTPPAIAAIPAAEWERMTDAPRVYGWHATLKPPFELAEGAAETDLIAAAQALARTRTGFALAGLSVQRLGRFVALRPDPPDGAILALAEACVREFEPLRKSLTSEELAVRDRGLSARQREFLHTWGYPYVFDEFRFHMTLTGALEVGALERAAAGLTDLARPLEGRPVPVGGICIFQQPTRSTPFRLRWRIRWGGALEAVSERGAASSGAASANTT